MNMLPSGKPQLKIDDALQLLNSFPVYDYPVKLLGVRGYYKHTMGNPDKNDLGVYDDAIFILAPNKLMLSYNANTDPSSIFNDHTAMLKPGGPYLYKIGMHGVSGDHPYRALRQYGRVTVLRKGKEDTDTAQAPFYIDIHRGGYNTTSSLGCQTIHPDQWPDFFANVERLMDNNRQQVIPYCLVEY
jgi:lysozyme